MDGPSSSSSALCYQNHPSLSLVTVGQEDLGKSSANRRVETSKVKAEEGSNADKITTKF